MSGNGFPPKDFTINNAQGTTIPASTTDGLVSNYMGMSGGGATVAAVWVIDVSAVTGTVPIRLQQTAGVNKAGTEVWVDVVGKTVNAAVGRNYIRFAAVQDPTLSPLLANTRLVATTPGGASVTIDKVLLIQPS